MIFSLTIELYTISIFHSYTVYIKQTTCAPFYYLPYPPPESHLYNISSLGGGGGISVNLNILLKSLYHKISCFCVCVSMTGKVMRCFVWFVCPALGQEGGEGVGVGEWGFFWECSRLDYKRFNVLSF